MKSKCENALVEHVCNYAMQYHQRREVKTLLGVKNEVRQLSNELTAHILVRLHGGLCIVRFMNFSHYRMNTVQLRERHLLLLPLSRL